MNSLSDTSSTQIPELSLQRIARNLSIAAALVVIAMFATFIFTGIGQDPLQFFHPSAEYSAILLRNPPVLRIAIGLDNLFIVLYVSLFIMLAGLLWNSGKSKALIVACIGLLCLSGTLDMMENMHFMTMLAAVEQGMGISPMQIELQVWESLTKFHISYLGLFLLGFALPNATRLEMILCFALRWVQLPVGLLIYLVPKQIAVPLVLTRFTFFLVALLILASVFQRHKFD
jgi:hypothetical protein